MIPVVEGRDCDPLLIVILRGSHFTALLPTHHCGVASRKISLRHSGNNGKRRAPIFIVDPVGVVSSGRGWMHCLPAGLPGEVGDLLQGSLPVPDVRSNRKRTAGSRTGSGMGTPGPPRKRPKRGTGTGRGDRIQGGGWIGRVFVLLIDWRAAATLQM